MAGPFDHSPGHRSVRQRHVLPARVSPPVSFHAMSLPLSLWADSDTRQWDFDTRQFVAIGVLVLTAIGCSSAPAAATDGSSADSAVADVPSPPGSGGGSGSGGANPRSDGAAGGAGTGGADPGSDAAAVDAAVDVGRSSKILIYAVTAGAFRHASIPASAGAISRAAMAAGLTVARAPRLHRQDARGGGRRHARRRQRSPAGDRRVGLVAEIRSSRVHHHLPPRARERGRLPNLAWEIFQRHAGP